MSEVKDEVIEEKVEVSPELAKSIADTVVSQVNEQVEEKINAKFAEQEKVVTKSVGGSEEATVVDGKVKTARDFVGGLRSLLNGDNAAVRAYNEKTIASQVKAGYLNEGTSADGGVLVPPADFIAEVVRLEEVYGVARRNARVRTVNGNAVTLNKKNSGVTMYETGEGVAKTGTKMTFGVDTVQLRKFAAIAPLTDELTDDAAVDVWNELTIDFAREAARIEDTLVFTDDTTGILNASGVVAITTGNALDQLILATTSVPTQSMQGGKFYMHRTYLSALQQVKDSQGRYIWQPGVDGNSSGTIWGYPIELVEVLPHNTAIFGNLQYATLITKRGLQLTRLTEGTIHDASGNAVNLAEQDMQALRAVTRLNARVQFPAAFAVLTGGTLS